MQVLDWIVKYWVIIGAVIAGIAAVAVAGQRVLTLEDAVKAQAAMGEEIQSVQTTQAVIQTQQQAVKEDVREVLEQVKQNRALMLRLLER